MGQTEKQKIVQPATDVARGANPFKGVARVSLAESSARWLARLEAEIDPGSRERIVRQSKTIPVRYIGTWAKAVLGESSMRGAVKAKCYDCVAFEAVAEMVGGCTSRNCPLWAYRPHQAKAGAK